MGFFETLAGAAAPAGVSAAGGVISNLINQNSVENEATRNQSNFGIQMDETIQRRVADAKKAGLHPLYALGASSSPSSQPIVMQDSIGPALNQAGQNIATNINRQGSADDRLKTVLENKLLDSQIGETDARKNLIIAQQAQMNQVNQTDLGVRPEIRNSLAPEGQAPNPPGTAFVENKPSTVTSSKTGNENVRAGINPMYEERWMAPGFPIMLPVAEGESPEELLSEMSAGAYAGLLEMNANKYGGNWLRDYTGLRFTGKSPGQGYLSLNQQGPRRPRSTWSRPDSEKSGMIRGLIDKMWQSIDPGWKKGGK